MEDSMTTLTAPTPQANAASNNGGKPINLFQLGCLFVIRASYWSCRIGNDPADFHLAPDEVKSKAIASFGSKELIDPTRAASRQWRWAPFQQIEKKARHQLAKYSKPFPAANAHFVPWEHARELIDKLEELKAEFDQAVEDCSPRSRPSCGLLSALYSLIRQRTISIHHATSNASSTCPGNMIADLAKSSNRVQLLRF